MDAEKLQLKIFVTADSARAAQPDAFIAVFHRWIKDGTLPELVLDVANYAHVPEGPGASPTNSSASISSSSTSSAICRSRSAAARCCST